MLQVRLLAISEILYTFVHIHLDTALKYVMTSPVILLNLRDCKTDIQPQFGSPEL